MGCSICRNALNTLTSSHLKKDSCNLIYSVEFVWHHYVVLSFYLIECCSSWTQFELVKISCEHTSAQNCFAYGVINMWNTLYNYVNINTNGGFCNFALYCKGEAFRIDVLRLVFMCACLLSCPCMKNKMLFLFIISCSSFVHLTFWLSFSVYA